MSKDLDTLKSVFLQLKEANTPEEAFKIIYRNHFDNIIETEHDKAKQEFKVKLAYNENFKRYRNITCCYCYNYEAATEEAKKTVIKNFKKYKPSYILLLPQCYYYFVFSDLEGNTKETLPKRKK